MSQAKYPYLSTPMKIGKTVFRNRLLAGPAVPVFGQSAEIWPSDAWVDVFAARARSGAAAVVCCGIAAEIHPSDDPVQGHMDKIDGHNPNVQHRFAEIAEIVKAEGAVPFMQCMPPMTKLMGYDVSSGILSEYVEGDGSEPVTGKEIPESLLYEIAEDYGEVAALAKTLGFQGVQLHMAYRHMLLGRFLSPSTNKRTDKFGGCLENRARFPLLVFEKIKKAAGPDMLIHIAMTAEEPFEDGLQIEDTLEFLKMAEGKIDLVSLRGYQIDIAQGPHFVQEVLPNRESYKKVSRFLHENNVNIKLAYVCGGDDLDACEDLLAGGEADCILASRAFVSDPDYAKKMLEGRGDDVIPCLRCNKCHQYKPNFWSNLCSVNPEYALSYRRGSLVREPGAHKNIAVIGGGCAGMKAAIDLFDRGHTVTIYEKEARLGGQLNLAGIPKSKWTLARFRDYLVHQVEKRGIKVELNKKIAPGEPGDRHELVFVAIGAVPARPPIPGAEKLLTFKEAFECPDQVTGKVVVIGGGEIGLELSLYLVQEKGLEVCCIEMLDKLAPEMAPVHFRRPYREMWESQAGFSWLLNSRVTRIEPGKVFFVGAGGEEKSISADTVILAAGTKSLCDEAMQFGADGKYRLIGDCFRLGNIATAMRSAHFEACKI
ncbi:MAG: FAD-dependent oxidoreductase [Oscillospiraceae bacterium]